MYVYQHLVLQLCDPPAPGLGLLPQPRHLEAQSGPSLVLPWRGQHAGPPQPRCLRNLSRGWIVTSLGAAPLQVEDPHPGEQLLDADRGLPP